MESIRKEKQIFKLRFGTVDQQKALNRVQVREPTDIFRLKEAFGQMRKDRAKSDAAGRTRAPQPRNTRKNVLSVNIVVGDYVVIGAHVRKFHKWQTKRQGPILANKLCHHSCLMSKN